MIETSREQMSGQNHENLKTIKREKFLQVVTFFPRSFVFTMLLPTSLKFVDMEHKKCCQRMSFNIALDNEYL